MNDYAIDTRATVCLHVPAKTEAEARQVVKEIQAHDLDHWPVIGDRMIRFTEFSVDGILRVAYAVDENNQNIPVAVEATDEALIDEPHASELRTLIARWRVTQEGDSNDEELDAAADVIGALETILPREPAPK